MTAGWFFSSSIMFCELCQKHFATKYTFKRHMQLMHPAKETDYEPNDQAQEFDNETNDQDQESDYEQRDVFEQSEMENDSSGESMEQTNSNAESEKEEEEPDFWTMIIRHVVEQIYKRAGRKSRGGCKSDCCDSAWHAS